MCGCFSHTYEFPDNAKERYNDFARFYMEVPQGKSLMSPMWQPPMSPVHRKHQSKYISFPALLTNCLNFSVLFLGLNGCRIQGNRWLPREPKGSIGSWGSQGIAKGNNSSGIGFSYAFWALCHQNLTLVQAFCQWFPLISKINSLVVGN